MDPTDHVLDWLPAPDPRSRNFSVVDMPDVPPELSSAGPPRRKLHRGPGPRIDQGREGACVGFAKAIALMSAPVAVKLNDPTTFSMHVYNEARVIDGFPTGTEGTSLVAGAKILQRLGWIDSYWWAFGIDQVLLALASHPVVLGINWYHDMYWTDVNNIVHVGGSWVGGHAITATGYARRLDPRTGKTALFIRWRNSWGPDYGNRGDGWIRVEDLDWLLRQHGEACVLKGQRWVPLPAE